MAQAHVGHPHDHDHHPAAPARITRTLAFALFLTAVFFVAELIGGFVSRSLALLADAGHMFTDVGALALSLFVAWFSQRPASAEKTYGYLRLEILAALVNGAALLATCAWIVVEAVSRLQRPEPIHTGIMLGIAIGGLLVNALSAYVLHGAHTHSLNARGAYLHVVGDLLGSVGTVAAAIVIRVTGWLTVDPIVSVLVTLLVVRSAWKLVRESIDVLLEATPSHISIGAVRTALEGIPGVSSVHDLHVWTVSSGMVAMSAHALVPDGADHDRVLQEATHAMLHVGIRHVTVQIERDAECLAGCLVPSANAIPAS